MEFLVGTITARGPITACWPDAICRQLVLNNNTYHIMNTSTCRFSATIFTIAGLALVHDAGAISITSPGGFTAPMTVIDYSTSPGGPIAGGTSITTQYSSLGVIHDGSTTTPPGPPGISSASGLPGLESNAGDPDPFLPITVSFMVPVNQVGAYFLMGSAGDSITLTAFRTDTTVIDTFTIAPGAMPLTPGPFGFNEGFIGLILPETAASVVFAPSTTTSAFVIDDLHFGNLSNRVPETGSSLALLGFAFMGLAGYRRILRR